MNTPAIIIAAFILLLQGCSYAISPDVAHTADRTIIYEKLAADPPAFTGKTVILGGVIVKTNPAKSGTLVEIVQKELDYWGKPLRTDRTGGRFLVLHPGFLDAMVYAPGREVTVAGEVTGTEQKAIGNLELVELLVKAREMKLWPREKTARETPSWLDPLNDPNSPSGKYGY